MTKSHKGFIEGSDSNPIAPTHITRTGLFGYAWWLGLNYTEYLSPGAMARLIEVGTFERNGKPVLHRNRSDRRLWSLDLIHHLEEPVLTARGWQVFHGSPEGPLDDDQIACHTDWVIYERQPCIFCDKHTGRYWGKREAPICTNCIGGHSNADVRTALVAKAVAGGLLSGPLVIGAIDGAQPPLPQDPAKKLAAVKDQRAEARKLFRWAQDFLKGLGDQGHWAHCKFHEGGDCTCGLEDLLAQRKWSRS